MPDIFDSSIVRAGVQNVTTQSHKIEFKVRDPVSGQVLADYTGDQALYWPACLNLISIADQDEFVNLYAPIVMQKIAGN